MESGVTQSCGWWQASARLRMIESKGTSPDDLLKALKRYREESGEPQRAVASQIGINHHIFSRWQPDK